VADKTNTVPIMINLAVIGPLVYSIPEGVGIEVHQKRDFRKAPPPPPPADVMYLTTH